MMRRVKSVAISVVLPIFIVVLLWALLSTWQYYENRAPDYLPKDSEEFSIFLNERISLAEDYLTVITRLENLGFVCKTTMSVERPKPGTPKTVRFCSFKEYGPLTTNEWLVMLAQESGSLSLLSGSYLPETDYGFLNDPYWSPL